VPLYEQVAAILRGRIAAGEWSRGPLPSNRALQETYDVGEYVVTHAIRLLEDEGLVFTVPRRGTYVRQHGLALDDPHVVTVRGRALRPAGLRIPSSVSGDIGRHLESISACRLARAFPLTHAYVPHAVLHEGKKEPRPRRAIQGRGRCR